MLKVDEREKRDLADLRGGPVHALVSRSYEAIKEQLVLQSDPDRVRTLQGQAQVLRELLGLINPDGFSTNGKRA